MLDYAQVIMNFIYTHTGELDPGTHKIKTEQLLPKQNFT